MITLLITLLVIVLVCWLVWWAAHRVMSVFKVDPRARVVIEVILVLIFALVLLSYSGLLPREVLR